MLTSEEIKAISDKINETVIFAKKKWPVLANWETPTFSVNLKGTSAGRAHFGANHIKINPILFRENSESMLKVTCVHEIAHLVAFHVYKDRGHGKFWKHVMVQLGLKPDRCHSYDVANARVRSKKNTVTFRCGCRNHEFTSIRAKRHEDRMQRTGKPAYKCNQCNQNCIPAEIKVNFVKKTITSFFS